MEEELRSLIYEEISGHDHYDYLKQICNAYFEYYYNQSENTQLKFKQIIGIESQ